MDQRQIELVRTSFARAERIGAHVAATFYAELFALDPSLRPLFKNDMIRVGEKLMAMLHFVVDHLDRPAVLLPAVRALAVRHSAYGVEPDHYRLVGLALMRTLKHELGADFTTETRTAWTVAYQVLADTMIQAAAAPPRAL